MASLPAEMYQDLKDLLPSLIEAIKISSEYGMDLAFRFIVYDLIMNLLAIFAMAGAYLAVFWGVCKVWSFASRAEDEVIDDEEEGLFYVAAGVITIIAFMAAFALPHNFTPYVQTVVKDLTVPELRIVEIIQQNLN